MGALLDELGMTEEVMAQYKRFVGLDDQDISNVTSIGPKILEKSTEIVDGFYTNVEKYPELLEIIRGADSNIDRLKGTQHKYLKEVFGGIYDGAYFEGRIRIGVIHNRIGLTPRWYLGSYSVYRVLINKYVSEAEPDSARAAAISASIGKLLSMDGQIAIETYNHFQLKDLTEASTTNETLTASIDDFKAVLSRMADGDLRKHVVRQDDAALNDVGVSINAVADQIARATRQANTIAVDMASSLNQVQQAITSQNVGATEQASAVSETSSSLEEMRATSNQTLDTARMLGENSQRTSEEGDQGLQTIQRVADGMNDIREAMNGIAQTILSLSDQTQQIGDITNAVSNIAQQSKMLALNASIEAAKAGEAGRGFAVVASEVKDLAEQSHQSTSQVQRILQDIRHATDKAVLATETGTKGVTSGLDLVDGARAVMSALVNAIEDTSASSQQMVAAIQQEAQGIQQAARAVSEISSVTSQFASSTKETDTTAKALTELAGELLATFDAYELPEETK
jgi:methyl-accepting chemotaxis protein